MCTTIKGHVGMSAGGHLRQDPVHWWSPKEIRLNPIYGDRKWCVTWIGGHRKVYWLSCCVTPFDCCYGCCIVHCYLFGLSNFLPMYVWSPGLQLSTFMVARNHVKADLWSPETGSASTCHHWCPVSPQGMQLLNLPPCEMPSWGSSYFTDSFTSHLVVNSFTSQISCIQIPPHSDTPSSSGPLHPEPPHTGWWGMGLSWWGQGGLECVKCVKVNDSVDLFNYQG